MLDRLLADLRFRVVVGFGGFGLSGVVGAAAAEHIAFVQVLVGLLPCWGFLTAGLVGWSARPANRTGPLMTLTGVLAVLWIAPAAVDDPLLQTLGVLFFAAWLGPAAQLVLAFPAGRITTGGTRAAVIGVYFFVLVVQPLQGLFFAPDPGRNLLYIDIGEDGYRLALALSFGYVLILGSAVAGVLIVRWRHATPAARRILSPVVHGAILAAAVDVALNAVGVLSGERDPRAVVDLTTAQETANIAFGLIYAVIPFGFLVGLLRTRTRSGMEDLLLGMARPGGDDLVDLLARALGDPSLQLGLWVDGTYVTADGRRLDLRGATGGRRAVTPVEADGRPLAVLVHDPSVGAEEGLVEAVAAAARLAIENERLHAEVRAQLAAVQDSRQRIVEAADAERRRLERNLHDGAQQRLVSLALALRMMRNLVEEGTPLVAMLERADVEARGALEELRELASGVYPAALEDGLGPALRVLAERSPVAVELGELPAGRLPPPVERAAYFAASEALANVAKYSEAGVVHLCAGVDDGHLRLEVADDGKGGADPAAGTGLRGLADRVEALGGRIEISSPPGEGTRIVVDVPARPATT